jgi:amidase
MHKRIGTVLMALALAGLAPLHASAATVQVEEVSAADLLTRLASGATTSEALVRAYLARIGRMDRAGPALRAVIALNPDALAQARALDAERKAGTLRGPLHGLPILVKDNVETADRMPTTAGSLALKDNVTGRDAPAIARLRAAGALILGKTNLSEWANIRADDSISGWSGVGGLTRNPYVLDRTACGSSSGTGAAIAASFAAIGIGSETDGSVTCPSAMNGLAGLKPSIGLVSRTHVVPISHSQDTLGPMGRSVRDVALLFSAMVGSDPADPVTSDADRYKQDYAAALTPDALSGVRLGVVRPANMPPLIAERYDAALARLKAAGAVLVDVEKPKLEGMGEAEFDVLKYELKADLNAYLASTPATVKTRTLADVIAFNKANAARELGLFGQDIFEAADKLGGLDSPAYLAARAKSLALARDAGLDMMLKASNIAAIVSPTYGPPGPADPAGLGGFLGFGTSGMPAIAGYPHLTVPMGLVRGLPVGLSFIGAAFTDGALLRYGHAFEATGSLREAPKYLSAVPAGDLLEPME